MEGGHGDGRAEPKRVQHQCLARKLRANELGSGGGVAATGLWSGERSRKSRRAPLA